MYGEGRGAHCFACGYHQHGEEGNKERKVVAKLTSPLNGVIQPLSSRKIDEKTCRLYDYRLAKSNGKVVHVANYWRDGALQAQHVRFQKPKDFRWKGDASIDTLPLYGQHLWSGEGKRIVVTEGEIDCLTVSMLWKNRWPVVSLPSGVQSSESSIRTNLDFLSGYDEIVLAFDNDEPGRLYAEKCAEILPPGKVKIAHFPLKDANAMHLANKGADVLTSIYEARSYQPDGIMHISDVVGGDKACEGQQMWTWPWRCLTKSLMGMRSGEISLIASGTGSGKSTFVRELAYHHVLRGRKVGMLMLEESPKETQDDMIAMKIAKPVRQIRAARELNAILEAEGEETLDFGYTDNLTDEEYMGAKEFFDKTGLYVYDHHGSSECGNILQRVEYLAAGLECDLIFVDHVTAMVAGMEAGGNERASIDMMMNTFASIRERTGCHIVLISQLNRLQGTPAEEGGQVSMNNLRGSGSLGSVPNNVLAIERNQQAEDPDEKRVIKVRSLKGRFTGDTGVAGTLQFNTQTRRLEETEWVAPTETDDEGFQSDELDAILGDGQAPAEGEGGSTQAA